MPNVLKYRNIVIIQPFLKVECEKFNDRFHNLSICNSEVFMCGKIKPTVNFMNEFSLHIKKLVKHDEFNELLRD